MPQITLEYTANIGEETDFKNLFLQLHSVLEDTGKINIENCKSRALKHENYAIGKGETENAFVHLTVKILEGRPAELKQKIADNLLSVLVKTYSVSKEQLNLQITVELLDIQRQFYFKYPGNTFTPI